MKWKHSKSGRYTLVRPDSPHRGGYPWTLNEAVRDLINSDFERILPWEDFDEAGKYKVQEKP